MTNKTKSRREFVTSILAGTTGVCTFVGASSAAIGVIARETDSNKQAKDTSAIRVGLNLSCLMSYKMTLEEDLAIAYQAGFRSVEIWVNKLKEYLARGKSLDDLRQWLEDHEMRLENLIGFSTWIADDDNERAAGLKTMKEEMEMVRLLGGAHIAACAAGARKNRIEQIDVIAARYRNVLELGKETGVRPLLELWGAAPTLSKLEELVAVAVASQMDNAGLLLDFYHLFRGGNSFESLGLIAGSAMPVFHINDYPNDPPREHLADKDRVFPGDGICPLPKIIRTLVRNGFEGVLSLELFNQEYQRTMTPLQLAQTGRDKILNVLEHV